MTREELLEELFEEFYWRFDTFRNGKSGMVMPDRDAFKLTLRRMFAEYQEYIYLLTEVIQ